jgi:hypothetical protein
MLGRFHLTPAGWFWYLADEQAGPFATYDEAVEHQREYQRHLDAPVARRGSQVTILNLDGLSDAQLRSMTRQDAAVAAASTGRASPASR